jgi:hypothetical protein
LNFKNVRVGSSKTLKLNLKNGAKKGSAITFSNPIATIPSGSPREFSVTSTNCPQQLQPKQKCQIFVEFGPQSAGAKAASVTISDNASNRPQTVPLVGKGK